MDCLIFIIGLFTFIGLIGYSIYLLIKKQKDKLKKNFIGIGISFILMIVGLSWGASKTNSSNAQLTSSQPTAIETKSATQQNNISKQNSQYEEVKVTKHIDGDTVEITHKDGKTDKVRFIGVNTPESTTQHEQYGQEASDYTKNKLLDKTVYLEKDAGDKDTYGRLLRYVWLEIPKDNSESEIKNKMFNSILAEEGYAEQMTVPPNVKYADYFKKFCAEARTNNKGLWAINPNGTTKGDNITPAPTQTQNSNSNNQANNNQNTQPVQPKTENVQQPSAENNQSQTVYIGATGTKYHRETCRTLKSTKTPISLEEAKAQGREACKVCNP